MAALLHRPNSENANVWLPVLRLAILLLPTALLVIAGLRYSGTNRAMIWLGTAFQVIVCSLSFVSKGSWRQPVGPSVITLYLIGLAWLWWGDTANDWLTNLSKAILLVVPLTIFGFQTLYESGAPAIRRARLLANRLADRHDWPADLPACRSLPEVKALRAALHVDAAPALALLDHPRPAVRVAALAALEFRKEWRPGQAELVLQVAQRAEQPAVRAAAVAALGNVDDRILIETVAHFLHDTAWEVRKAAIEALLWDTENRWGWFRYAMRRYLADPMFASDGAVVHEGGLFGPEAIKDLTAWCAEKGLLAQRAALTVGAHFARVLAQRPDESLIRALRKQLADPHLPAVLRLELGRLLQNNEELDQPLLEKLLEPSNPAPLRLIASETILKEHAKGPSHSAAVAALRDLARLPNREIALATADVIQRRLGVDLGMGLGQPLPPAHSRQAAEITRRVMSWATQYSMNGDEGVEDSLPVPPPGKN